MGIYKHRTKSGRIFNFKSKDAYEKWNKGRFLGLNKFSAKQQKLKPKTKQISSKRKPIQKKLSGKLAEKNKKELLAKAKKIHAQRPLGAQELDDSLQHELTIEVDDRRAKNWFRGHYRKSDLIGVDDYNPLGTLIKEPIKPLPKRKLPKAKKRSIQKGKTRAEIRENTIIKELVKRKVVNDPQSVNVKDLIDMKLTAAENKREVLKLFGFTGRDRSTREKDIEVPQKDAILRFLNLPVEQQQTDLKRTRKPTYTNANLAWYNDPSKSDVRTIDTKGDYQTRRKQLQQVAKEKQQEENINEWRKRITKLENKPRKTNKEHKELSRLEKRLMK